MQAEPVILSLETATLGGSIFLSSGTTELAARFGDPQISHSNTLLADINECLNEAGLSVHDVKLFACASGPGSFTGLRIGIATVKALAATLNRPTAGVSTLAAIAHSAGVSSATVSLLPAGRGEVFAQMFQVLPDDEVIAIDDAAHLSPEKLMDRYGAHPALLWAGPGVHIHLDLLRQHAKKVGLAFSEGRNAGGWRVAPADRNLAQHVAVLALKDFQRGSVQTAETIRAIYVRLSDAEINQPCR